MYADENTPEEYGAYHEPLPYNDKVGNPVAGILLTRQYQENDHNTIVGNVYAQLEPVQNLKIRTAYGFDAGFGSSRSFVPTYKLTSENMRDKNTVRQDQDQN